jgi:hypothetical protein
MSKLKNKDTKQWRILFFLILIIFVYEFFYNVPEDIGFIYIFTFILGILILLMGLSYAYSNAFLWVLNSLASISRLIRDFLK